MASSLLGTRIGNASASSLVKSASSIQTQLANYQDQVQALTYANSAYTDDAYQSYQQYLQGRINTLSSTGTVTDASKALTLTKTMESAMHSNISATITRENIQIMSGNGNLSDKYNVIVSQYQRAMNNGDLTLAQTLENQAYGVNQQIQYQAQQSADAAAALNKAYSPYSPYSSSGGSSSSSSSSTATLEGQKATNLTDFLKSMTGDVRNVSERALNAYAAKYANDPQVKQFMQSMGVNITSQQPNYWDLVYGIAGAAYNHTVLKAQAEASTNPILAQDYAMEAHNMLNGQTKFDTLAGGLTVQQIQQAQQDPSMFSYDNTSGGYKLNTVVGYQYMPMDNGSGGKSNVLVPTYSGIQGSANTNKVYFLTPQETTMMANMGLRFASGSGKSGSYAGDGALVQATENTPAWLRSILGNNGTANVYTDSNGFITFKAGNSSNDPNNPSSFYTLARDAKGLGGLYEHLSDGSTKLVGGDYGFAAQAVNMLMNKSQQVQTQVVVAQQKAAEALRVQQAQAAAQLQAQQASQRAQAQAQAAATARSIAASRAASAAAASQHQLLQRTVSPQVPTYNPQPPTFNPQQTVPGSSLQGGNVGAGLNQSGSGGIKLGTSSGPTIKL